MGALRPIRKGCAARTRILYATLPVKETLGLENRQRRNRWKDLPWASLLAKLLPGWRSAAAGLLLIPLLVPYASGAFVLAGREGPSCGMACCKGSKVCSCRRLDRRGHHAGPGWDSSSKCPEGCGQLPAVSGAAASIVVASVGVSPVLHVSRVRTLDVSPRLSSESGFVLFERPPPTL